MPVFIMVTNFVLVLGGLLAVAVFLIVLSAAGEDHLPTVWRVCFGIGIILPLSVFFFRLRMLSSKLYRRGAIKRESMGGKCHSDTEMICCPDRVPYRLTIKRYWRALIGTSGAWFLYDFVRRSSFLSYFRSSP